MSEVLRLLLGASPLGVLLSIAGLVVMVLFAVFAPILRLDAKAWFLRRRGVSKKQVAEWALAEVKRDHPNPLVEVINALRKR
ncbi:MAG: hypothetical protein ACRDQU_11895 [Pseudonocardiaceae bacterium]